MSLLDIFTGICEKVGLDVPTVVIGNSDNQVKAILSHLNTEGRQLAREHDWTVLTRLHTLATVASTAEYALPSDYDRFIRDTEWDEGERRPIFGSTSAQDWREIKSSLIGGGIVHKRYRVFRSSTTTARKIYIDPTPTAAVNLTFEYISTFWCSDSAGATPARKFAADTDVCFFDEDLMELGGTIRYLRGRGFDFASQADEYMQMSEELKSHDKPAKVLYLHNTRGLPLIGGNRIPDTGYGQ